MTVCVRACVHIDNRKGENKKQNMYVYGYLDSRSLSKVGGYRPPSLTFPPRKYEEITYR